METAAAPAKKSKKGALIFLVVAFGLTLAFCGPSVYNSVISSRDMGRVKIGMTLPQLAEAVSHADLMDISRQPSLEGKQDFERASYLVGLKSDRIFDNQAQRSESFPSREAQMQSLMAAMGKYPGSRWKVTIRWFGMAARSSMGVTLDSGLRVDSVGPGGGVVGPQ